MTLKVRPVDLAADREELLDILQRNLPALAHARRFEWFYLANPAGRALSWFAYETDTRKSIGVATVVPKATWVGKEIKLSGQVADFAVDRSHRTLGPALMLQRATFSPVDQGMLNFCYDCPPHDRGMSTFHRLGMKANCQMGRYARLLRTERQIEKRVGKGPITYGLAALGNAILSYSHTRASAVGVDIGVHEGRLGEEFSRLDEEIGGQNSVRNRRQAEDLNWRYRDDPLHAYRILTARRRGELIAYVIYSTDGEDAYVIDLFGRPVLDLYRDLLEAVIEDLKGDRVQTLQLLLSDSHLLTPVIGKWGFSYRSEGARIVVYGVSEGMRAFLNEKPSWAFCEADVLA